MNLLDYRYDKYSCCGNDGIIEKIFDTIQVYHGRFVEFGAWDGIKGCNCRQLWEGGWSGTFIEPHRKRFTDLVKNYKGENIKCINSFVGIGEDSKGLNSYDDLVDFEADFCSIDIDGMDLAAFESIEQQLPTVVCMEGGQMLHPSYERIPDTIASQNIQQSLSVIDEAARKKGYRILCSYQDTFMIKECYYDLFSVEEDVYLLYLDGVKSIARRLPWIKEQIEKCKLKNELIDLILEKCNYEEYGWPRRKEWAIEESSTIDYYIERLKREYKDKRNSQRSPWQ